jgi:hypothetical protein
LFSFFKFSGWSSSLFFLTGTWQKHKNWYRRVVIYGLVPCWLFPSFQPKRATDPSRWLSCRLSPKKRETRGWWWGERCFLFWEETNISPRISTSFESLKMCWFIHNIRNVESALVTRRSHHQM